MTTAAMRAPGQRMLSPEAVRGRSAEVSGTRFARLVTALTFACVAPTVGLLWIGTSRWAGLVFWVSLGAVLLALAATRRADAVLCILLATSPMINLLRGFAFYNVIVVLFGAGLLLRAATAPEAFRRFLSRQRLLLPIAAGMTLFYLLTFATTQRYDVNLRVFEFLFAAAATLLVARDARLLAAALQGLLICSVGYGIAFVPHTIGASERLGIAVIGGRTLGNPIQIGIPLAAVFLALFVDRGAWISIRKASRRLALVVPVAGLLLLTSSRASWLVVATGVLCVVLLGRGASAATVGVLLAVLLSLQIVRWTPLGESLNAGISRTFDADRDVLARTSGRSDQWVVAYYALTESARSILIGHGPGRGPEIYARKSFEIPSIEFEVGEEMALHSLQMQVAVELGLLGLLPLLIWLGVALARVGRWTLRSGWLLPLTAMIGYAVVTATVSGNDTASGILAGLGLVGAAAVPRIPRARPPA